MDEIDPPVSGENISVVCNNILSYRVLGLSNPPPWFDEYVDESKIRGQCKPVRVTVKRDNRFILSQGLPIVSISNMRSLHPKLRNFQEDLSEREISLALLSEAWENSDCQIQKSRVEEMCQMHGYKYISTPRMKRRGGGASIVADLRKFSLKKQEVSNPDKVEAVWGLLRPKIES